LPEYKDSFKELSTKNLTQPALIRKIIAATTGMKTANLASLQQPLDSPWPKTLKENP
jgi:hypothetical protein